MTKVKYLVTNKTDFCSILENKPDQSFPNQQFQIHRYNMFRRGQGQICWRDTILCKWKHFI